MTSPALAPGGEARTAADSRPVVAVVDRDRPGTAAVAWAAAEAARRAVALLLLPLHTGAALDPADAALLVVDATTPGVEDLVTTARCPVVTVLGLGPVTAPAVIGFAMREAEIRGVALRVVRTWDDPTVDLGRPLPAAIARWDEADERGRRDVTARLAGQSRSHPDVETDVLVVHESCGGLLPALALGTPLLVVGQPTGGNRSPALAAVHWLLCPVAVVPAAGSGGDIPNP